MDEMDVKLLPGGDGGFFRATRQANLRLEKDIRLKLFRSNGSHRQRSLVERDLERAESKEIRKALQQAAEKSERHGARNCT